MNQNLQQQLLSNRFMRFGDDKIKKAPPKKKTLDA